MKKRFIVFAIVMSLALCMAVPALADSFNDVDRGHWAYGYIEKAASLGLVYGVGDGAYDPEANVSYAEFCTMLVRLLFPDDGAAVQDGPWYAGDLAICLRRGVLKGTPVLKGEDPNLPVPRVELARLIENAMSSAGVRTVTASERAAAARCVADIGEYSASDALAIEAVYAMGVMNGVDVTGRFAGRDYMTRAEAATVLMRMRDVKLSRPVETDPGDKELDAARIYESMVALKAKYPEGTRYTNANSYVWHAIPGVTYTGYGCAGFAFMLSDAAFGDLPARKVTGFTLEDVRVGDILRINNDTHSVIVLEVRSNSVIIAEGNYNSSVHWGRELPRSTVESANYMYTRYPD